MIANGVGGSYFINIAKTPDQLCAVTFSVGKAASKTYVPLVPLIEKISKSEDTNIYLLLS